MKSERRRPVSGSMAVAPAKNPIHKGDRLWHHFPVAIGFGHTGQDQNTVPFMKAGLRAIPM